MSKPRIKIKLSLVLLGALVAAWSASGPVAASAPTKAGISRTVHTAAPANARLSGNS